MQLNAAVARPGAARSLSFPRGARPRAPISATHRHREKFDDSMKRRADRTSTQRLLDVQDVKQQGENIAPGHRSTLSDHGVHSE